MFDLPPTWGKLKMILSNLRLLIFSDNCNFVASTSISTSTPAHSYQQLNHGNKFLKLVLLYIYTKFEPLIFAYLCFLAVPRFSKHLDAAWIRIPRWVDMNWLQTHLDLVVIAFLLKPHWMRIRLLQLIIPFLDSPPLVLKIKEMIFSFTIFSIISLPSLANPWFLSEPEIGLIGNKKEESKKLNKYHHICCLEPRLSPSFLTYVHSLLPPLIFCWLASSSQLMNRMSTGTPMHENRITNELRSVFRNCGWIFHLIEKVWFAKTV